MRTVQYIPRATEKSYNAQVRNEYMFYVPQAASKQEIAKQIGEAFKVTVIDVRTTIRKGKKTKYSKGKHAYPGITYRRDHKIAYITLKDGDKIPVFEEVTETKEEDKSRRSREKNSKTSSSEATPENLTTKSAEKDAKAEKKAAKAEEKEKKSEEKVAKKATKKAAKKDEEEK